MLNIRTTGLLAAVLVAVSWPGLNYAEQAVAGDAQTIEHIQRLEQMLRDAGIEPPARPDVLEEQAYDADAPIIAPSFATAVFETEVAAINARSGKSADAIEYVRRWLERDDVKRRVAAEDIIETLTQWSERAQARIRLSNDPIAAYIIADEAIALFEQDPLAKPFKRHMQVLRRDRSQWHHVTSMAAYRRAIQEAEAIGLTGDWSRIDFQNTQTRLDIKAVSSKLALIANTWPNSDAANAAQADLDNWQAQQDQIIADLPAWRYTWQLDLINIGTETRTTLITKPDGSVFLTANQRQVNDPDRVSLYGTFQNTSDKPYRYTFVAGVTSNAWPDTPFTELDENQLIGFEVLQTPVLQPGELYKWQAFVAVDSINNLNRGGITRVEVRERNPRR